MESTRSVPVIPTIRVFTAALRSALVAARHAGRHAGRRGGRRAGRWTAVCTAFSALSGAALAPRTLPAQLQGAAALDQSIRGLTTTARVLIIAAHPDDEDTQTIAYLARGKRVETAYLSLTRGDGGQNLIGPELGESLGAIRTEELLAARRLDGGRQYFTRAFDFGFSKNAEETAKHWPRDSIVGDVVTVIRAFRPHVIYSVWSGTRADGHGHHEFAGVIAREAYDAAGDTIRFPVKRYGAPWEPLKFYRRGSGIALDINAYDPVLGRTYADIAAESRSQHRSQGFGGVALRGLPGAGGRGGFGGRGGRGGFGTGTLRREASRVNANVPPDSERSIFDGVDTTFARLVADVPTAVRSEMASVGARADSAMAELQFRDPARVLPLVARMAGSLRMVETMAQQCPLRGRVLVRRAGEEPASRRCTAAELDLASAIETLERRAERAVLTAGEIDIDAIATREFLAFGDSTRVTIAIANHGRAAFTVSNVRITGGPRDGFKDVAVLADSVASVEQWVIGYPDLRPAWMGGEHPEAMFGYHESPTDGVARVSAVSDDLVPSVAVSEERRRVNDVWVTLEIAGQTVLVNAGPLIYRATDPLLGVQDRPLGGVPPVTLAFDGQLEWLPGNKPIDRFERLTMKSYADSPQTFSLKVVAPKGLRVDSVPPTVTLAPSEQRDVFIRLRGSLKPGRYEFGAVGEYATGAKFAEGFSTINYPHIRPIYKYRPSGFYLQAVQITLPEHIAVAYVQGVGDASAGFLRQLEIPVTTISPAELPQWDLSRFTTVVIGTRAFEASSALLAYAPRLLDFAKKGGTLVVQYGQNPALTPGVFPFPMKWDQRPAQRVTDENAHVTVLDPKSKLLTFPNIIGDADWQDWVQERAVYMPSAIDPRYQTPLEMHDPDEPPNKGAIVMTPLGKGMYVFTTLALFRQMPGAVPGGARLFVNLLSAGSPEPVRKVVP